MIRYKKAFSEFLTNCSIERIIELYENGSLTCGLICESGRAVGEFIHED